MGVEQPLSRVSRSEGGARPTALAKKLDDIRMTSQKQALQHTVRAKKLDERQLFRFLKSLDDSKNRRLLQIDKEVAEVEKLLKRLSLEQEAALKEKEERRNNLSEDDEDDEEVGLVTRSANAVTRRQRVSKKKKTTRMSKEFDEYAFRARQKRGSIGKLAKDKADKALNSYYRFDSGGNRRVFSPLISSPSKTPKPPVRPAWDPNLFFEDMSMSNYTVATETDSRVDSATNKSLASLTDDAPGDASRAATSTPGKSVFLTSGRSSSQANQRVKISVTPAKNSKAIKTPKGVDELPTTPRTPKSQKGSKSKVSAVARQQSGARSVGSGAADEQPNDAKVSSEADDEIPLDFIRSRLKLKRRPDLLEMDAADSNQASNFNTITEYDDDELRRVPNVNGCTDSSCQVADCIFHRPALLRRQSSTIRDNPELVVDEYYRAASTARSRMTGQHGIDPVFQSADDRKWNQARRVHVSPPSPTPSEILADIVIEQKDDGDKPDYTDLETMMSVRRPMKGSNRDLMLKEKEDNIKNTFKIMRKKMAASVPQDFNMNYGTPTPNWKILNPLKMRHKIAHKSPLFTLWKLN